MLHELCSNEYTTYKVIARDAKDDYVRRKVQKDRKKLLKWLNGLLADREVIIFYKDEDEEKVIIGSLNNVTEMYIPFPEMPLTIEIVNNQEVLEQQHCFMYEQPTRTPIVIHVDQITKFIVRTEGLSEIHKSIRFNGP